MSNLLSSLLSPKDEISLEMRRKIESSDVMDIMILCVALRNFYNVEEKVLETLIPQAAQIEQLIEKRLATISPNC
jgi:hypothetical protein